MTVGWWGEWSGAEQASGAVGKICWVRLRRSGFVGFSVKGMANKAITKEARRAAREAAAASQEELARRTKANVEDLATFFSARERADSVDEWLSERQQALREQAAQRRGQQRVQCGRALHAMRERGESVREIARMAGVTDKTVRELIREAEAAAPQGPVPASETGVEDTEASGAASNGADVGIADVGTRTSAVDESAAVHVAARTNA